MVGVIVEHDFDGLLRDATTLEKRQLPFATSLAMNRTLKKVKKAEEHEIRDVFDRPTPFIQRSVFMKPTNKNNLVGFVGIKDQSLKAVTPSKILIAQITGGTRRLKRYEVALRSIGVLPSNYFTVPGEAAPMDSFGNISKGLIVQILSFFKAFGESGFRANSTEKTRARLARGTKKKVVGKSFFVIQPGHGRLMPGIWMRIHSGFGSGIRPVLMFVPFALYEPIFDFQFVAENTIKKEYGREFNRALREALLKTK